MSSLTIAKASLLRVVRDRVALFFMIALPILVIVIIGSTVRGFSTFTVGVVDQGSGSSGSALVSALRNDSQFKVQFFASKEAAAKAEARGEISIAILLPKGEDASLRAGRPVAIDAMFEQSNSTQQAAYSALSSVVASQAGRLQAAAFASAQGKGSFDSNLALATDLQAHVSLVNVITTSANSKSNILPEGFSYSAPTMLVLFVFINTTVRATSIVETRKLGIYERISAAPVRTGEIIAGETLGLLALAVMQAGLIVAVGSVGFGVSWGDPLAAVAVVALWALVSSGAGMLAGTIFRSPEQASAIGPTIGLLLGMLGGCMWPLEIVSPLIRNIGHATPQSWAVDAWTAIMARGANLSGIAIDVAVMAAFGGVLTVLATFRLRRQLT